MRELRRQAAILADLRLAEYIRICVDEDEQVARRAYTRATMGYALGRHSSARQAGYRAHFGRMGYDADLTKIEEARDSGAPEDELIDAFPDGLLKSVGYYGRPDGAAAEFRRLSEGLDIAIVAYSRRPPRRRLRPRRHAGLRPSACRQFVGSRHRSSACLP